ncbi:MAG: alpha/beta hydrolase [Chitinophagaceae bacterium]|nr:alpha/beta hydrolase [Chitinophagaceae bacterium]MCW5926290.1 alpha/beta hydrolase [Chitinophagaceae bacterium]
MHIVKLILCCFFICRFDPVVLSGPVVAGSGLFDNELQNEYDSILDVAYGDAGRDNLLDIHLPKGRDGSTKLVVYIHGGSWVRGDKKEFPAALLQEMVGKRKYGLVSMNYRLVKEGKNIFPAQIEDVQKAIAYLRTRAKDLQYDPDNYALMGASAGAHLALLYAYGYDSLKQVKAVVDIFGPSDLTDEIVRRKGSESNDIIENFLATGDTAAQIAKTASPIYHLNSGTAVPTLIFHGTADSLVHVSQSEMLYAKLQEIGAPSELELFPGEKHELRPQIAFSLFGKMLQWLQEYYKP